MQPLNFKWNASPISFNNAEKELDNAIFPQTILTSTPVKTSARRLFDVEISNDTCRDLFPKYAYTSKPKYTFSNGDELEEDGYQFNGLFYGSAILRCINGDVLQSNYIAGIQQGQATQFLANNGAMSFFFKDGVRNGEAIHRFLNGDILRFSYENGIAHGHAVCTYYNGSIETFTLIYGRPQGPAVFVSPVQVIEKFNYVNGVKEGPSTGNF